jgi:hypothetical protein
MLGVVLMNKDNILKFCGKAVNAKELSLIKELAEEFWGIPQTELASTVCELLNWTRANGKLKTVECRQFLQGMEEVGLIKMPLKRTKGKLKSAPVGRTDSGRARAQITGSVHALGGAILQRVESSQQLQEWKAWWTATITWDINKPLAPSYGTWFAVENKAAYLAACSFPAQPGKYKYATAGLVGTKGNPPTKNRAKQAARPGRFLILPWVVVKGLASHVLGRANRLLPDDWQKLYGYRPLLLETFVEARFRGTSYSAANWLKLGQTQGRGRMDRYNRQSEGKKTVWVYPLHRRAKRLLSEGCS